MRRSADLLLRVYRNNDFLAAKAVAKSTLKPRTHSGLSFAPCPVAGQDVRCPKSVQADLPPPSPPAEKATTRHDQAGKASTGRVGREPIGLGFHHRENSMRLEDATTSPFPISLCPLFFAALETFNVVLH
jgi:hypothetical protein